MKKLVALLVALMMLCGVSAMAETVEYELNVTGPVSFGVVDNGIKIDEAMMAMNGADTAVITDELCTIYSDNMIIKFDLTEGGFVFVTQDFYASYMGYLNLYDDAQAAHQAMVDSNYHLYVVDKTCKNIYLLYTVGTIKFDGELGTLSMLSEDIQDQLCEQVTGELGGIYGGIVKFNDTVWAKAETDSYMTIVDGNILLLCGSHYNNGQYESTKPGDMEFFMQELDIILAQ